MWGTQLHHTHKKAQQAHLVGHCLLLGFKYYQHPAKYTQVTFGRQNQTMTNLHLSLDWPNSSLHTKGKLWWEGERTVLVSGQ